ncbi:MAG: KAP family NTPase [Bacteroidota bacterium]|nr:KAP family NTPase [Bacteroidota bacterium]
MKIKHKELEIPPGDPFKNCQLQRKKYGDTLTYIVNSYADGFVLALNNEWGTGKTTFVKMWQQSLKDKGFKTLYFNAWENDFNNDPLVALMSELKTINPNEDNKTFKSLLTKGAVLTKHLLPGIIKAIAEKYIDSKTITEAIENATKSATDILKDEINEYAEKKKGLIEFRDELEKFVKENSPDKPLIFIIDELDRCRPNFAVEVLEQVKHFFGVTGIVFVISIDKVQLGNAIKGFYGSELINSNEYLRRFIDLEFVIPKPKTELFCNYLFSYFDFDLFFSEERWNIRELADDKTSFLKFSAILFDLSNTTLRQQEKIFSLARLALNSFNVNTYLFPPVFILLIYIKDFKKDLFDSITNRTLLPQELIDEIRVFFPKKIDEYDLRYFTGIEARLVLCYNNYYREIYRSSEIFEKNLSPPGPITLLVKSRIDDSKFSSDLQTFGSGRISDISLKFLLDKINLLDSFSN